MQIKVFRRSQNFKNMVIIMNTTLNKTADIDTDTNTREIVESTILQYPICEYAFGSTDRIPFSDKVWYICETDCERYGKCWACPPHCGTILDNIKKCRQYSHFVLFSTVTETANAWDSAACLRVKKSHEELTQQIAKKLQTAVSSFFVLSTGCTTCEVCACPTEPCRHPEERLSSMESHGIVVMQMAEEMELCYQYGSDTIVYFSMIFFNEGN